MSKNTNQNLNWGIGLPDGRLADSRPHTRWRKNPRMNACRIFALSDFSDSSGWILFINLTTRRMAATISNPSRDKTHVSHECKWISVHLDEFPKWSVVSRRFFKTFDETELSCLPDWFWTLDDSTSPFKGIAVRWQTIWPRAKRNVRELFPWLLDNALFLIILVSAPLVAINLVAELFGLPRIW